MPEMQVSFSFSFSFRLLENMKPKAAAAIKIQMEEIDKQLAKGKDFFSGENCISYLCLLTLLFNSSS